MRYVISIMYHFIVLQTGGKYIVTNSSLRILDVHQTDSGFYTCRASNNWGQEAKTVLLTVLGKSSPEDNPLNI